jgi:hypothetical protein
MADEAMDVWYVNLLARPPRRVCPNFGSVLIGYYPVTENGEALAKFSKRHGRQFEVERRRSSGHRTPGIEEASATKQERGGETGKRTSNWFGWLLTV